MKSNPARELAKVLESWTTDDQRMSLAALRATAIDAHPYDESFWIGVNRAVALLDEYRRVVDTLPDEEEAEYHRSQFHALHALVYAPDSHWGSQGSATLRDAARQTLTTLRLAARALDNLLPAELNQSQGDTIVGHLREALRLTTEALPNGVEREHLSRAIVLAIQFADDVNRFSGDAVRVTTGAVIADLQPLTDDESVPIETRRRLKEICRDLFYGISTNMAAAYGVNGLDAGAEVMFKSITGN